MIITGGIIVVRATGAENLPKAMMEIGLGAWGFIV